MSHSSGKVMDEDEGVYKCDRSGFVGEFILKATLPDPYPDLMTNAAKFREDSYPWAWGFQDYFKSTLGGEAEAQNDSWYVFTSYEKSQPGDIIIVVKHSGAWRDSMIKLCGHASSGHVMVAWSFPVQSSVDIDEFWI